GRPGERPRDDAADEMLSGEDLPGESAEVPQLLGRPDLLVRRDLKHRVAGGIQDRPPGGQVLRAELLNDLGSGGRLVAEDLLSGILLERLDDFARESPRVEREGTLDDEAHHLPMPRRRVLAGREL